MIDDAMRQPCPWCGGRGTVVQDIVAGPLLARMRETAGIGQSTMSARLGFSRSYLCDLEHGKRRWTPEILARYETELRKIGLELIGPAEVAREDRA